jgi:hypothetical protein
MHFLVLGIARLRVQSAFEDNRISNYQGQCDQGQLVQVIHFVRKPINFFGGGYAESDKNAATHSRPQPEKHSL